MLYWRSKMQSIVLEEVSCDHRLLVKLFKSRLAQGILRHSTLFLTTFFIYCVLRCLWRHRELFVFAKNGCALLAVWSLSLALQQARVWQYRDGKRNCSGFNNFWRRAHFLQRPICVGAANWSQNTTKGKAMGCNRWKMLPSKNKTECKEATC